MSAAPQHCTRDRSIYFHGTHDTSVRLFHIGPSIFMALISRPWSVRSRAGKTASAASNHVTHDRSIYFRGTHDNHQYIRVVPINEDGGSRVEHLGFRVSGLGLWVPQEAGGWRHTDSIPLWHTWLKLCGSEVWLAPLLDVQSVGCWVLKDPSGLARGARHAPGFKLYPSLFGVTTLVRVGSFPPHKNL